MTVPVIDLFAGPGGLGEGFSRARTAPFRIAVSIEKDGMAFETLQLRAAHRALMSAGEVNRATWRRWDSILAEAPWNVAFEMLRSSGDEDIRQACELARKEAWNLEMGPDNRKEVSEGIRDRLAPYMRRGRLPDNAVLIGGPPCQAYSIVGRSRNRGTKGYSPENDSRHFLYKEYLQVINEFRPAVFVMENVKGILSSKVSEQQIFQSIHNDLRRPDVASGVDLKLEYELVALGRDSEGLFDFEPEDFIVEAEAHGVPQARHRVIICGVRKDVFRRAGVIGAIRRSVPPTVREVISDLPRLRCALSHRGRGLEWLDVFDSPLLDRAIATMKGDGKELMARVARRMEAARNRMLRQGDPGTGGDRMQIDSNGPAPAALARWYRDRPLSLLANHESRAHMPSDLVRYLFVSAFGEVAGSSPRLHDFPSCLLPKHKNVDPRKPESAIFKDRFRVQVADTHSMTVTSHIHKDGHAFIHFDSSQCRSLTVREAARLQSFPDSYVFLGNRTSQYVQVGNAVPPYLAVQIAEIVGTVLDRADMTEESRPNVSAVRAGAAVAA